MPASLKVVVLGGSDVGIITALRVRELCPHYEVSVVLKDSFPNFSICGIPFYLGGEVPGGHTSLAHRTRQDILDSGMKLYTDTSAISIDEAGKTVKLVDNNTGEEQDLRYDKLVIGTGARSVKPNIEGMDLPNVLFLRTIGDTLVVEEFLDQKKPNSAVIIGGGYVGLEMTEALTRRGIKTAVVEKNTRILKTVDEELSQMVQEKLESHGIKVVHGNEAKSAVKSISKSSNGSDVLVVETDQGEKVEGEMVLVSVGATPASEMFSGEKTTYGAIIINKKCETSVPDIYAGGDVAQTYHSITGKPVYFAIGTVAHKHGRIIAENICGLDSEYPGTIFTQSIKLFDMVVTRTGMRQDEAEAAGFDAGTVAVVENDHKKYFPPFYKLHILFTAEKSTGRILGIQMVGNTAAEVSKRIDIVAVAIQRGVTVNEFIQMDLSYTPPLSAPWDPTQTAAQAWRREFVEKK